MDEIRFLTLDEILAIHAEQLDRYGGQEGILDRGVVESATAMPMAAMYGNYLHEDIAEMAGAYLFHFAAAQGFADGNKRTAVNAMVTFLGMNGFRLACKDAEMYKLAINVAVRATDKASAAIWIRERLEPTL